MATLALAVLSENTSSYVPLIFFRAKVSSSPLTQEGKGKALELAYYVSVSCFGGFVRGKSVSIAENVWGNLFFKTLFIQDFCFDGVTWVADSFFVVFCRGVL